MQLCEGGESSLGFRFARDPAEQPDNVHRRRGHQVGEVGLRVADIARPSYAAGAHALRSGAFDVARRAYSAAKSAVCSRARPARSASCCASCCASGRMVITRRADVEHVHCGRSAHARQSATANLILITGVVPGRAPVSSSGSPTPPSRSPAGAQSRRRSLAQRSRRQPTPAIAGHRGSRPTRSIPYCARAATKRAEFTKPVSAMCVVGSRPGPASPA